MRNSKVYEEMVQKFVAAHGPAFELLSIERGTQSVCSCCGYHPLVNCFHVRGEDGSEHIVGSECQEHVLGAMGKPSAEFIRGMSIAQLATMGQRYGIDVSGSTQQDASARVISARRGEATRLSWFKRRAKKAAALVPSPTGSGNTTP